MNHYKNKLMSKNGIAIISLAKEMFSLDIGSRIKTVEQYSSELSLGRGTIHTALRFLENEKAITLEMKGHLGTYISFIDYKKLWIIADIGTIMGVMPLPYSKRYEGLATGLYKTFEKFGIPFNLAFMRGSSKRIEELNSGRYNFVILSKLAATLEMQKKDNIEIAYEFPKNSYVGDHVIIFRDKNQTKIMPKMRIGIDHDSMDQLILTNYECNGIDVEFIDISYTQILRNLKNNVIDAAVWNGDELKEQAEQYRILPLNNKESIYLSKEDTIAVIVVNKENKIIREILSKFIDINQVSKIQEKIMKDEILPTY